MVNRERVIGAASITGAALIGAFASRWIEYAYMFPEAWQQVLILILATGILFLASLFFLTKWVN